MHHEILGFSINPVSFQALTRSGWYSPAQYWQAFTRIWVQRQRPLDADEIYSRHVYVLAGFLTAAAAGMWFADAQGLTCRGLLCWFTCSRAWVNCLLAPGSGDDCCPGAAAFDGLYSRMWFLTQAAAFLLGGYVATFTQYQTTLPIRLRRCPSIPTCW